MSQDQGVTVVFEKPRADETQSTRSLEEQRDGDWIIARGSDGQVMVSVPRDRVRRVKIDLQNQVVEDCL